MSVVEFGVLSAGTSAGALARLESFAALNVRANSGPAIGGFRFVPAKHARRDLVLRRTFRIFARPVPLLLIGVVALAILARPDSEPHAALSNDSDTLERLTYGWTATSSKGSLRVTMGEEPTDIEAMNGAAQLELAALSVPVAGASPITTSALPPVAGATVNELRTDPVQLGVLPTASETLADAPPKLVRLAAITPVDDALVDVLPTLDVLPEPSGEPSLPTPKSEVMDGASARPEHALTKPHTTSTRAHRARSRRNATSKKKRAFTPLGKADVRKSLAELRLLLRAALRACHAPDTPARQARGMSKPQFFSLCIAAALLLGAASMLPSQPRATRGAPPMTRRHPIPWRRASHHPRALRACPPLPTAGPHGCGGCP